MMTESPARYGLPTECPAHTACPGCPHNAAHAYCRPPAFFQSGTKHDVLTGSLDVLYFLILALDALNTKSPQPMNEQASRGINFLLTDLRHAMEYGAAGQRKVQ